MEDATRSTQPSAVLSEPEAAEYLGMAPRTLRGKRLAGEIAYVQITERRIGYRKPQLDEYLDRHAVVPEGLRADAAELARRTREAQGLTLHIDDPATLATLARLLSVASDHREVA